MLLLKVLKFLGMINIYMYKEIVVKMFKKGEFYYVNNMIFFWYCIDFGLLVFFKLFFVVLVIYYDIIDWLFIKKV